LSGTTCNTTTTTFSPAVTTNDGDFTAEYYSYVPELLYTYQGYQPNGLPCDEPPIPECSAVGGSCINGTCQEYGTYYACGGGGRFVTINGTPTCEVLNASTCDTGGSDPCRTKTAYPTCPNSGTRSGDYCTAASTYAATETVTVSNNTRIIKNTSGTVSTLATYAHSAAVRSLQVTTSNSVVTINAFAAQGQSSLLNSNTYTAASPTRTAVAGILVAPSPSGQSATLDNFYLK
jgi:hypothetical protein